MALAVGYTVAWGKKGGKKVMNGIIMLHYF